MRLLPVLHSCVAAVSIASLMTYENWYANRPDAIFHNANQRSASTLLEKAVEKVI